MGMRWLRICLCAALLACGWASAAQAEEDVAPAALYCAETGHNIRGEFADYYQALGGEAVVGRPLTDEFIHGQVLVQIFERLGFERPLAGDGALGLIPLGLKLGRQTPPLPASAIAALAGPNQRHFPETGHLVMEPFLALYEELGGEALLGQPITEIAVEEGRIVQYYEYGSLEWAQGDPEPIRLGRLGEAYLRHLNLPASLLKPVNPWAPAEPSPTPAALVAAPPETTLPALVEMRPFTAALTSPLAIDLLPAPEAEKAQQPTPKLPLLSQSSDALAVSAAVRYPVTGQGGSQTVYVQVRDGRGERVSQARVEVVVRFSADQTRRLEGQTGPTGRAALTFEIGNPAPGAVVILDVAARKGAARGATQTLFTSWR